MSVKTELFNPLQIVQYVFAIKLLFRMYDESAHTTKEKKNIIFVFGRNNVLFTIKEKYNFFSALNVFLNLHERRNKITLLAVGYFL